MTTRDEWGIALLTFGEWPVTYEKRIGMVAWGTAEGSEAQNNMLDTTEPAPGATDYNSAGVKNYESEQSGIEATYATLMNGRYQNVVAVLADEGSSALSLATAVGNSPWGTGDFSKVVENVKADPEPYFSAPVAGNGSTPTQQEDDMPLAVTTPPTDTQRHVYRENADGTVQHWWQDAGSSTWNGPEELPGAAA